MDARPLKAVSEGDLIGVLAKSLHSEIAVAVAAATVVVDIAAAAVVAGTAAVVAVADIVAADVGRAMQIV